MKPIPFFYRILLFSFIFLAYPFQGKAQEFYASQGTSGGLVKIAVGTGTCSAVTYPESSCLGIGTFTSIAMLRDTFYSMDFNGDLNRFVLKNGAVTSCKTVGNVFITINALTIDGNGVLYAASGNSLYQINSQTAAVSFLGSMPFYSGGDLAFYEGHLYMAADFPRGIVKVNIADPSLSTMYIPIADGTIVGLANVAVGCNENRLYAQSNTAGGTEIIELNMAAAKVEGVVCTVPYYITDAASPVESGNFSGINIQSIKILPECTNRPGAASIQINTTASTTPYTYLLNNTVSNTSGLFTGLTPGNYAVHISSAGGCTRDTNLVIAVADTPNMQVQSVNSFCTTPNGSLTVTATSLALPLSYSLNNGTGQPSGNFGGLSAGNYIVEVTDSNGCSSKTTATVQATVPTLSWQVSTTVANCGNNDGAISITSGATTSTYSIGNGVQQSSGQFNSLTAGSYLVSTFTAQGCRYDTTVIVESKITQLDINISITPAACHRSNGALTVTATPNVREYSINNGARQPNGQFTKLSAGSYLVSAFNALGCRKDTTIIIADNISAAPAIQLTTKTPDCYNRNNGAIEIAATGPNAPFTYRLADGAFSGKAIFANLQSATYRLSVRDSGGCVFDTVATIPAYTLVKPVTNFVATNPACLLPQNGTVLFNITGGSAPYQINYQNNLYPVNHLFDRLSYGKHLFQIQDRFNCTVDSILIPLTLTQSDGCDTIYIPNAFTPGKDGKNDVFKAAAYGVLVHFTLSVYNRFGQLVFHSPDITKGWDGKINGLLQPAGAYAWMIKYAFENKPEKKQKGTVLMIR